MALRAVASGTGRVRTGVRSAASAILGPVAGRTFIPNQDGGSGNPWILAETSHILIDDVSGQIEIWWPNWRATGGAGANGGAAEALQGAAATGTAQITYTDPALGTQVVNLIDKTGGTTTLNAADGDYFKAVATINARRGSRIYPRIRANFPNGMVFSQWEADISNGDLFQFGASVPSLTTTPTNSFASNLAWYGPCAILAMTAKRTAGINEDSRGSGFGDRPNDLYGFIGQYGRLVGRRMGYINVSVAGETAQDFAISTQSPRRTALLQMCTDHLFGLNTNDVIFQGRTSAQGLADAATITARVGKPYVMKTLDPASVDQNTNTPARPANEAQRLAYNTAVRALTAKYDPAAVLESGTTSGTWGSLTYTLDGTHETNTANALAVTNGGFDFSLLGNPALYTIPAFSPTDLGTLLDMWLDASDAATITTATGVSQWSDKSGKGNNATQATGASQPSYASNAVTFSATTFLSSPLSAANSNESIFAIVNAPNLTGTRTFLGPSAGGGRQFRVDATTGILRVNRASTAVQASTEGAPTLGAAADHLVGVVQSQSSTNTFEVDGTTGTATGAGGTFAASTTLLGRSAGGADSAALTMKEIIVLNANPTTGQRQKVEGYLAWKWGLQGNLPAGHPYKNAAP